MRTFRKKVTGSNIWTDKSWSSCYILAIPDGDKAVTEFKVMYCMSLSIALKAMAAQLSNERCAAIGYKACESVMSHFQIAKFMGPTCGPPGSCRPQMGPMLAP